jgi:hypothetical protein
VKKQFLLIITVIWGSFPVLELTAQEALLSFPHSRVVKENYNNEISTIDQVVYYDGKDIVYDRIDCLCERNGETKIAIELSKSFDTISNGLTYLRDSKIILELDLVLVAEAFLQVKTNQLLPPKTYSLSKMNVQLSNFDYDRLNDVHGVVKLELPKETGFAANERYVHFRFKCNEGRVTKLH